MLNDNEILCDVPGFAGRYKASNKGYITNGRKIMKTYTINSGYPCLKLQGDSGRVSVLLHRVIAECFIENPDDKPEVNHKDGDKTNSVASNLEWVTSSENKRHAFDTGIHVYNNPTLGKRIGKSSSYHNVSWDKARRKWVASIRHKGKTFMQKRFSCEKEAAKHVNHIIDFMGFTDRPKNVVI